MNTTHWLQDAASLAMDALLARLDLDRGARPFFWVDYQTQPPHAHHSYWDACDIAGRFVDGLALARLMTGRQDALEAELMLRRFLWAQQDERDGLFYNSDDELPGANTEMSKYIPAAGVLTSGRHIDLFCQRAPLICMTTLLQQGDESMRPRLQKMVRGLMAIAHRENTHECSFPTYRWAPVLRPEWFSPVNIPEKWQGYRYALLTGLARYAQISGDPVAIDLAFGLARHYMQHGDVPPDGRYRANTHSGGVLPVTVGIARLGVAFDQPDMIQWAQKVYEWTRENTPEFGFLRDGLGLDGFFAGTCETCGLADFVHLAVLLSDAGIGDYWDDAERAARNQLLENQYHDAGAIHRVFPGISDDVHAMLHGGFECAATPNNLFNWVGAEGCCIGGGLRALYLAWRGVVSETARESRVNLGISRETPAIAVTTYEPWEGRIDVRAITASRVSIRLPGHASINDARTQVDDTDVRIDWQGRYAIFDLLKPGQTACLSYPLHEMRQSYDIAGSTYTAAWRGNTVMDMQPQGTRYPIYQQREIPVGPARQDSSIHITPAPILW